LKPLDTIKIHEQNDCREFELKYEFYYPMSIDSLEFFNLGATFVIEYLKNNFSDTSKWHFDLILTASSDPILTYWCNLETLSGRRIDNANVLFTDGQDSISCITSDGICFTDPILTNPITIIPSKISESNQAVNLQDIILTIKHILGIDTLQNPYSLIAADINKSGEIDIMDILEMRKLILDLTDQSPVNQSWVFIPKCYEFNHPEDPLNENYPTEEIDYFYFLKNRFWGIKLGDVNFSSDGT
jgi:hypothetical protein